MNKSTEKIWNSLPSNVFSYTEAANVWQKSNNAHYGLLKRAVANKELLRIRRGLYCLAPRFQRHSLNLYSLAQRIYGPSYISLESALSYHGLIPEAVYTVTSVSKKKSREFATPVGNFSYSHIPLRVFYTCVDRISDSNKESFFMATPLKALTDYVYVNQKEWKDLKPVLESLRVDQEELSKTNWKDLKKLLPEYKNRRVERFIKGIINEY
ncbi:MAG: hypothetical protein GXP32_10530 [Kiritimatiellaeota bacterium]|nr:hypothetical protein [Kiritimatiellota bacterium]